MNTPSATISQNEREIEINKIIAAFKRDVDYGLLRENLKCTVEQRLMRLMQLQKFFEEMQAAGRRAELEALTESINLSTVSARPTRQVNAD